MTPRPQMQTPSYATPRANGAARRAKPPLVGPQSRFLRAARRPRPVLRPVESPEDGAREELLRNTLQVREKLVKHRAAAVPAAQQPLLAARPAVRHWPRAPRRWRWELWLLAPLLMLAALALLGSAIPVSSQTRNPANRASNEEMMRLIEVAKEAGLTEEEIRQISIEDPSGNVVNAYEYLQQQERVKQAELMRRQEELNRVYLTPQDIFLELRRKERADLDNLRERLPFDRDITR